VNGTPNARATILRGTSENAYGDPTDVETAVATGILCSIHEPDIRSDSQASDRQQQIGIYTLRAKYGTDILIDDRVKNEATGDIFVIQDVTRAPSIGRRVDVRCRMRKLETV